MCLEILTQGRSPLLSVKTSLFDVFKQLLTLHKLTPTSDATSLRPSQQLRSCRFSVHITKLEQAVTKTSCTYFCLSLKAKIVSMIWKYHNHKPQTTPWHREEEPLNHHETPGRQIKQSNQLSLPHQNLLE